MQAIVEAVVTYLTERPNGLQGAPISVTLRSIYGDEVAVGTARPRA
jgi:hypothetical protein